MQLPDNVKRLAAEETFHFSCHPGISCFTECCRELELALTPYDVLRLKNALALTAAEFLERYVIIEKEPGRFPALYLTMVDDGHASCPFVSPQGCRVYDNRPGACRAYPVGRAAFSTKCGGNKEFYVLVTEPHCQGFSEPTVRNTADWIRDQGLDDYNDLNDESMAVLQHHQIKKGLHLTDEQVDSYLLALYNTEDFRKIACDPQTAERFLLTAQDVKTLAKDQVALLRFGVRWLKKELFGE